MSDYQPPIDDMMFVLEHVVGLVGLPQMDVFGAGDVRMILQSAGQLASQVLAPLNKPGDEQGCTLNDQGEVATPDGFRQAYARYRDGGWNSVPFNESYGGQGLPWALAFALQEMWQSANMSFGLCPLLNQGAVEAIERHGSAEQKKLYLQKLISGEWTGTMNLTEPDAGSDLGAIKTRAVPQLDGIYKLTGQKIFITYGEHDFAQNIVHLVLARTPNAPEGVKGISLFMAPKYLLDEEGRTAARNDIKCVSLEHKLGIHASPTCTMQYGDKGGATGYLVGKENEGLKYMFTMMNNARLSVGLQGVAIAERAFQHALAYAKERKQGAYIADKGGERVPIARHEDVKRMLLLMETRIFAGRALTYEAGRAIDLALKGDAQAQDLVDLLTPVVKAWCTDMALEATSMGIQVFGGMGYIEEAGAAQYFRDARILPIYEGTNGIQALDLSLRKIVMSEGRLFAGWKQKAEKTISRLEGHSDFAEQASALAEALQALDDATAWLLQTGRQRKQADISAICVPYLHLFGTVAGGVIMAQAVLVASPDNVGENAIKRLHVLFKIYMSHVLPAYKAQEAIMKNGGPEVVAYSYI